MIEIRRLTPQDDLNALTDMLHRAYAPLLAMGLNYTAAYQDVETTRARCDRGETWLLLDHETVIGTGVLSSSPGSETYYGKEGVFAVHQFAIEPARQGAGHGERLLSHLEMRAQALGAREVALDTAGAAHHLIEWYLRRGYWPVDSVAWHGKRYASFIFSKRVVPPAG